MVYLPACDDLGILALIGKGQLASFWKVPVFIMAHSVFIHGRQFDSPPAEGTWEWCPEGLAAFADVVHNIITEYFHAFLKGEHSFLSPGSLMSFCFFFVSQEGRAI